MTTATIRQVQHNLTDVLRIVAMGEEVQIVRRKRPVAKLVPIEEDLKKKADWSGIRVWRARMFPRGPLPGKAASDLVAEGRGDR